MASPVRFDPYEALENLRAAPATAATAATTPQSVANVAAVAGGQVRNSNSYPGPNDGERAAIIEVDAGVPRAWAEGYALLLAQPGPGGVAPDRWQVFLDDCGRFLDGWAVKAAALGWQAHDLFTLADTKPADRIDLAGLCWLLQGRQLVALTERTAAIKTASGAIQRFYRTDLQPGQRVAWAIEIATDEGRNG